MSVEWLTEDELRQHSRDRSVEPQCIVASCGVDRLLALVAGARPQVVEDGPFNRILYARVGKRLCGIEWDPIPSESPSRLATLYTDFSDEDSLWDWEVVLDFEALYPAFDLRSPLYVHSQARAPTLAVQRRLKSGGSEVVYRGRSQEDNETFLRWAKTYPQNACWFAGPVPADHHPQPTFIFTP